MQNQQNKQIKQKQQKQSGQIQLLAYKKIVYHCLRYPSHKVYGTLISLKTNPKKITNAYPLFHSPIVNPSFSTALDLIESNLSDNQQISGFYQFIQKSDSSINRLIQTNPNLKNMKNLRVWMVDNILTLGMRGYELNYPNFNDIKKDIIKGQHNFIVDFDAHFEQIQLDFTNSYIN